MNTLIAEKKGMTQLYDKEGHVSPVTVLEIGENYIVGMKQKEKDGYDAFIIGRGEKKNPTKPEKGKYKNLKFVPKKVIEVRLNQGDEMKGKVGDKIAITFEEGESVKVTSISKGKGFQGVVKRWGFAGGPKTHGQSDRERAPGSIGGGTTPGRVFKGKKMPGRMGGEKKTVEGLGLVKVDKENNLIAIKGAVPGSIGSIVLVQKQ